MLNRNSSSLLALRAINFHSKRHYNILHNLLVLYKKIMNNEKPVSRRQRLQEMMKSTKDVCLPIISSTVTYIAANNPTAKAIFDNTSLANYNIDGAEIEIYPHFTRKLYQLVQDQEKLVYYTQAHGWVYSNAGNYRKKKIILTLAKKLVRSKNTMASDVTANEINEQLNNFNDQESVVSEPSESPIRRSNTSSSESSASSSTYDNDEILKERISNFVNRSLGNLEITICIGGENKNDLKFKQIITDENGNFNIDIPTLFKPTYIKVHITADEKFFKIKETIFPGESDYAIITDIDDTIKKTGICGDKRQLFTNTFYEPIASWEIPGASDCYRFFNQQYQFSVFYVSNSPYQLYSNLFSFFRYFEFPVGSIYLKKYSGNLLNSFMESSHTRKKSPLTRIFNHYQNKRFFLIGDSGEHDLEAYIDITRTYPNQVLGIYLRIAEGSLNKQTLKTIKEILIKKEGEVYDDVDNDISDLIDLDDNHFNEIEKKSEQFSSDVLHNRIELDDYNDSDYFPENKVQPTPSSNKDLPVHKKPPPIPKKPDYLKSPSTAQSEPLSPKLDSPISKPPLSAPDLPRRPIPQPPPALPARRETNTSNFTNTTIESNGYIPDPLYDEEKNDEWISRVLTSLIILRKVNPDIKLRFFKDYSEVQEEIKKYL